MCSLGRGGTLFALLEMQGPRSVKGFPIRDERAQDLVKARNEVQACQLPVTNLPLTLRRSLDHLSQARNERLDFVDCV